MGTRSLTYVYNSFNDENGWRQNEPIICLYRQYDGYLEGHGLELAEFLTPYKVVNGLGALDGTKVANGMGCLAAQLIAHFKDGAGQFYLHAPTLGADHWQEYEYHVFEDKIVVYNGTLTNDDIIFEGSWQDFLKKCRGELKNAIQPEGKFNLEDKDTFKSLLHAGETTITFEKVNGELREMRCTLDDKLIPETAQPKAGSKKVINDEVQPVYDLDAQHWKSFRWDSLKTYKVA